MINLKTLRYFAIFSALFFVISCSEDSITESKSYNRGEVIKANELLSLTPEQINQNLSDYGIPQTVQLNYTVTAISIEYQTEDANGNLKKASGALIVPQTNIESPMLSIQHGTETERDKVASVLPFFSVEGIVGLISASSGYVTCIPDYLGYGVSNELHPYVHAKSLVLSVIDFLRAAKSYCAENDILLNDQLFLGGYSEGGYATLASQREIEQYYDSEFTITACAPMAGPYDLTGTTKTILGQATYNSPTYIAFLLTAYNYIYGWNRIDDIFKAPYANMMYDLFDGSNSYSEINNSLPITISSLLNEDFINGVLSETDTSVIAVLQENSLLDWTPKAPIRFVHGDSDDTVPYQNSITARDVFLENGATNIELITIPNGTHGSSGQQAVFSMVEWFDSLRD